MKIINVNFKINVIGNINKKMYNIMLIPILDFQYSILKVTIYK